MKKILLIYGLPGSGKTTLAGSLQSKLRCPWFNADEVRETLSKDLGFSLSDRIEQARRMGCLAKLALRFSEIAIVDFVNPTKQTDAAFYEPLSENIPNIKVYRVFMNTIERCRFEDTQQLFDFDRASDFHFGAFCPVEEMSNTIIDSIL